MTKLIPYAGAPKQRPKSAEFQIHCAIVELLRLKADPRVIWFHPANGEKRNVLTAVKLKRMGVLTGVADLVFTLPDGKAAYMEVKAVGGRSSPEQKVFHDRCKAIGVPYVVVSSVDEAEEVLESWGAIRAASIRRRAA